MVPQILKRFYSCTIESITAWYGNCSASNRKVVRTAEYIKLPAIQDLYTRRCQRKALKKFKDSSHPSHRLFSLLPHGKQYRRAYLHVPTTSTNLCPPTLTLYRYPPVNNLAIVILLLLFNYL